MAGRSLALTCISFTSSSLPRKLSGTFGCRGICLPIAYLQVVLYVVLMRCGDERALVHDSNLGHSNGLLRWGEHIFCLKSEYGFHDYERLAVQESIPIKGLSSHEIV